jgi:chromosome segregation ATPase
MAQEVFPVRSGNRRPTAHFCLVGGEQMSYFTTVKHDDGSDIELYINDEQHIKELKAKVAKLETENVEMLNECSAYAEHQETLENNATTHTVEMRKIRKHNSDLKGQIKNQNLQALDATRDILRFLKQISDLEIEVSNTQERYRRLFLASNAVAIEQLDGTTEIII